MKMQPTLQADSISREQLFVTDENLKRGLALARKQTAGSVGHHSQDESQQAAWLAVCEVLENEIKRQAGAFTQQEEPNAEDEILAIVVSGGCIESAHSKEAAMIGKSVLVIDKDHQGEPHAMIECGGQRTGVGLDALPIKIDTNGLMTASKQKGA